MAGHVHSDNSKASVKSQHTQKDNIMSKETLEWLNANTMLGFTTHREKYANLGWGMNFNETTGKNEAWWHSDDFKNGYPDAIPASEVERVLFNWEPVETEIMHKRRDGITEDNMDAADGQGPFVWVPSSKFKGIMHPDTEYEFGIFGIDTYTIHGYREWLINNVSKMLDDEAGIATAGLLRGGGVAYVGIELPECIEVAGMDIRPLLLACTSVDGTKATTYKMVTQVPVCDNTLDVGLAGTGNQFKIKHSARSLGRLQTARDALGILYKHADEMTAFLDTLSNVDVTDAQFKQIVSAIKPIPDPETKIDKGTTIVTNQRAITIAENLHHDLTKMWNTDPRCKQWNGTLLGAFQTVNTWHNHERPNSDNGVERVMSATISGQVGKFDHEFFQIVAGLDIDMPNSLVVVG